MVYPLYYLFRIKIQHTCHGQSAAQTIEQNKLFHWTISIKYYSCRKFRLLSLWNSCHFLRPKQKQCLAKTRMTTNKEQIALSFLSLATLTYFISQWNLIDWIGNKSFRRKKTYASTNLQTFLYTWNSKMHMLRP